MRKSKELKRFSLSYKVINMKSIPWVCAITLFSLLIGCSTPQTRAQEKSEMFQKLSSEERAIVLKGKIQPGMNTDAVYIAFGEPQHIEKEGNQEVWVYTKTEFYEIPNWHYHQIYRHDGRTFEVPEYDPLQMKRRVKNLEVVFKNGKVVSWKKF